MASGLREARLEQLMRFRFRDVAFIIALASGAASCHSAQTSVTGPTADAKCQVTAASTPQSFTASGGTGAVSIATERDCTWTIATTASWLTLGGDRSGQGEASISYTVAANPVPTARSGSIVVGSQTVAVSQAAAPCTYSLGRAADTVGPSGGSLSVSVTTLSGCGWSATSRETWISIVSGQNGSASGTVGLNVAANPGAERVGVVNVGGQSYTVNQSASPPPPPAPAPAPPPPAPAPAPPAPAPPTPAPTPAPSPTPTPAPPAPAPTPPPAPSPGPGPSPGPIPPTPPPKPPGGGQEVEFDGTVSSLSGRCPNVSFSSRGYSVTADGSTDYKKKSECGDLREGRRVSVEGVTQANGTVRAKKIEVDR
jgi:hypothetical protein